MMMGIARTACSRFTHVGEGAYDESEQAIVALLKG
jgi:hypothetical protein